MSNELGRLFYTLGIDDADFEKKIRLAQSTLKTLDSEAQKHLNLKIHIDSNLNSDAIRAVAELTKQTNAKANADAKAALAAQRLSAVTLNQTKTDDIKARATERSAIAAQKQATEAERTALAHVRLENATKRAAAAQDGLKNKAEFVNKTFTNQRVVAYQLANVLGTTFSVYAIGAFINKLAHVRGEFELQQVAIRAIIRDKQAADRIFSQVKSLAVESPFQFKELVGYTKQLAAFSIETDKLFDTTKRLADVSAGLGIDMNRIVLAYGQVKAATVLRGQELRQFTEAGIPLVDKLAEKFSKLENKTVSAGDVFERISNRMVSFKDVDEIFKDLTSSGGMFFDMQKKQADTLSGKMSNLRDAYELMLNDIGQANEGLLKGGVNAISALIKNWSTIASVLKVVIAAYGAYKAAVLASIVANRINKAILKESVVIMRANADANIIMGREQVVATARTNVLTASVRRLWKAMLDNPITTAIVALTAIGVAIYEVGKRYEWFASSAEKGASSAKRLQEASDQMMSSKVDRLVDTYEHLAGKINRSASENKLLKETIADIGREVPNAITKLDAYGNAAEVNMKKVASKSKEEREAIRENTYNNLQDARQRYTQLRNEETMLLNSLKRGTKTVVDLGGKAFEESLTLKDKNKIVNDLNEVRSSYNSLASAILNAKKALGFGDLIVKAPIKLGESIQNLSSAISKLKPFSGVRDEAKKYVEGVTDMGTATEGLMERYNQAKSDYERMTSAKGIYAKGELQRVKNEYALYKTIKEQILGIKDKTSAKAAKEAEDKYATALKNRIDLIKQAKQQYEELSKAYGKATAASVVKGRYSKELPELQLEGDKYKAQFTKAMTDLKKHSSKQATALKHSITKDIKDIEQKGVMEPFDKALGNMQRFIDENSDRFDIYQKVLEITGSEKKALKIGFDIQIEGMDVETVLKDNVIAAAQKLQDEGEFTFDFDISYDNLLANLEDLPEKIRPKIEQIENFIKEKSTNALLDRLRIFQEETPKGMGLQFDFSKVLADMNEAVTDFNNKVKAASQGANDEELNRLKLITTAKTSAEKEVARQKIQDLGRTYLEENMMNKQLWASYQNMSQASITELSRMYAEIINMQNDLLTGDTLQKLGGQDAESPISKMLKDLSKSESVDVLGAKVNEMLTNIQNGQLLISQTAEDIVLLPPEETEKMQLILTLIKSVVENLSNAGKKTKEIKLDRELASARKLNTNIRSTTKSVEDLAEAMGSDLSKSVKDTLNILADTADGVMEVIDAISAYQKAMQAEQAMSATSTISTISGTAVAANAAVISTSTAAATSIKMVESASVILAIIGAVLAIARGIADTISGNKAEKADNAIKEQKRVVDSLKDSFEQLTTAADKYYNLNINTETSDTIFKQSKRRLDDWYETMKARYVSDSRGLKKLNEDYYKKLAELEAASKKYVGKSYVQAQIEDLQAQQDALSKQADAARRDNKKGKRDSEIDGYVKEIIDLDAKIVEVQDKWYESLRGTNLQSAADDFASAWVDAFLSGESAMDSFEGKFDEMIKNMIVKQAATRVMSKMIDPWLKKIDEAIGMEGELNANEVKSIVAEIPSLMGKLDEGMQAIIKPLLEAAGLAAGSGKTVGGLEGEIKGVSEDTAQLLASLLNAVRSDVSLSNIHLTDIKGILNNTQSSIASSLSYLASIDANTYNLLMAFKSVVGGKGSVGDGVRVWA